jgi:hypothetical protein
MPSRIPPCKIHPCLKHSLYAKSKAKLAFAKINFSCRVPEFSNSIRLSAKTDRADSPAFLKGGETYMSAFLVRSKTIDRILTGLTKLLDEPGFFREEFLQALQFVDKTTHEKLLAESDWQTALGRLMLDLNQEPLGARYGDTVKKLTYTYTPQPVTQMQGLKSMHCWLYQCHEGDIPEKSGLYKLFRQVVGRHWMGKIVTNLPEYDSCEWG